VLQLASLTDPNSAPEWAFLGILLTVAGGIIVAVIGIVVACIQRRGTEKVAADAKDAAIRGASMERFAINQKEKRRLYRAFARTGDRAAKRNSTEKQQQAFKDMLTAVVFYSTRETTEYLDRLELPGAFADHQKRLEIVTKLKEDVDTETT
jgi:hypothetical protein